MKKVLAALPPITLLVMLLGLPLTPGQKLLGATLGLLYALKLSVLILTPGLDKVSPLGLGWFLTLWPGMTLEPFRERHAVEGAAQRFVTGWLQLLAGILALVAQALLPIPATILPWVTLATLLLTIHFGLANLLTAAVQLSGFAVTPLFDSPLKTDSFQDFWSRRWNRPFVEMNKALFAPPLLRAFGAKGGLFAVFILSGFLHELAISFPAGGGYGLPLTYFALQGILMLAFRRAPRAIVWAGILLPLPLLFHGAFLAAFLTPLVATLGAQLRAQTATEVLSLAILLGGLGHFLVMTAAVQVPFRLNWRTELKKLDGLNAKLMWVYALYIATFVFTFGVGTLVLRRQILEGNSVALAFVGFIAFFWCLRIVIDAFFFKHDDWPKGPLYVVGHCLLTTLFVFLAANYGVVAVYHWWY